MQIELAKRRDLITLADEIQRWAPGVELKVSYFYRSITFLRTASGGTVYGLVRYHTGYRSSDYSRLGPAKIHLVPIPPPLINRASLTAKAFIVKHQNAYARILVTNLPEYSTKLLSGASLYIVVLDAMREIVRRLDSYVKRSTRKPWRPKKRIVGADGRAILRIYQHTPTVAFPFKGYVSLPSTYRLLNNLDVLVYFAHRLLTKELNMSKILLSELQKGGDMNMTIATREVTPEDVAKLLGIESVDTLSAIRPELESAAKLVEFRPTKVKQPAKHSKGQNKPIRVALSKELAAKYGLVRQYRSRIALARALASAKKITVVKGFSETAFLKKHAPDLLEIARK